MSMKQQLTEDMKAAMKAGEKHKLGVIRLINAAIKQREVDERIELDDTAVIAVLDKMVKQRKDSVSQFEAANREDLAEIERAEIVVIEAYLPAKMGEAEIVAAIQAAIAETGYRRIAIDGHQEMWVRDRVAQMQARLDRLEHGHSHERATEMGGRSL